MGSSERNPGTNLLLFAFLPCLATVRSSLPSAAPHHLRRSAVPTRFSPLHSFLPSRHTRCFRSPVPASPFTCPDSHFSRYHLSYILGARMLTHRRCKRNVACAGDTQIAFAGVRLWICPPLTFICCFGDSGSQITVSVQGPDDQNAWPCCLPLLTYNPCLRFHHAIKNYFVHRCLVLPSNVSFARWPVNDSNFQVEPNLVL